MADLKFRSYKDLPVATTVTDKDKLVGINLSTNQMELLSANGLGGDAIHIYSYYPNTHNGTTAWLFSVWTSVDELLDDLSSHSTSHAIDYNTFIGQCKENNVNFLTTQFVLHLFTQYEDNPGE